MCHVKQKQNSEPNWPEVAARMYDPAVSGAMSQSLFYQSVTISEQIHWEFVVGSLNQRQQLLSYRHRTAFPWSFHIRLQRGITQWSASIRLERWLVQKGVHDGRFSRVSGSCGWQPARWPAWWPGVRGALTSDPRTRFLLRRTRRRITLLDRKWRHNVDRQPVLLLTAEYTVSRSFEYRRAGPASPVGWLDILCGTGLL